MAASMLVPGRCGSMKEKPSGPGQSGIILLKHVLPVFGVRTFCNGSAQCEGWAFALYPIYPNLTPVLGHRLLTHN